ncbi:hypothetical protein [Leisingera caerulea]|uniref:Restriction endonuclease n=1 Tax=Leisingera caerulea TaxID=506591 RepID=A0A9Q9HL00_LEICA|nr:hypothetical protein [Leisingera caerulea]UWQ54721.1 hypothetical protein K3721_04110 [Leisingera caerulea]
MPITLTPFSEEDCYFGNAWQVTDEDELARQIGVIALGYSHHVQKILQGTGVVDADYPADGAASAMELLTVSGEDPSHRDGWMFQAMSWIAAIRANPSAKLASPHMQHADKGFDGLQVEIDDKTHRVKCAVVFEDKATTNPRRTITREDKGVWKEFRELENGLRFSFFTSQVLAVVRSETTLDPDEAIKEVIWKEARRYRLSITVGRTHSSGKGRKRLFKGYDEVVTGDLYRRGAETFHQEDIRAWLASLAEKAKVAVLKEASAYV